MISQDLAAIVQEISEKTGAPLNCVEVTFRFSDGLFFFTVTIFKYGKKATVRASDELLGEAVKRVIADWNDPEGAVKRQQVDAIVQILVEEGMDATAAREKATARIFG